MAVNDKPLLANSAHNPWGPRADKMGLALTLNDATSGNAGDETELNAFGERYEAGWAVNKWCPTVDTAGAGPAWATTEGGCLVFDGASDAVRLHQCSGDAIAVPRGTIVIRLSLSAGSITGAPVWVLGDAVTGLRLRAAGTKLKVTKVEGSALTDLLESPTITADTVYTVIVSWGEKGLRFYDSTTWQTDASTFGPTLNDGAMSTLMSIYHTGDYQAVADGALHAFAYYDWQPTEAELDELVADPYLYMRKRAATTHFETGVNPMVGRVKTDQFTLSVCTGVSVANNVSNRVHLRCLYSENSDMSDAVTSDPVTGTTALTRLNLTVTGLTAATYYWLAQYKIGDAGSWINFPGGRGRVQLQKATGTTFKFAMIADSHANDSDTGGGEALSGETETFLNTANKTAYGLSRMMQDIVEQGAEFVVDLGDSPFLKKAAPPGNRICCQIWRNFLNPMLKASGYYLALGNHEEEGGYYQRDLSQKHAFQERIRFVLNPDADTYPEGGENSDSDDDWVPALGTKNRDEDEVDQDYLDTKIHSTTSSLENYYAWTWGDALFIVLDPYRCTDVSENGTDGDNEAPWQLGPTQWAWLNGVLKNSTAKWKFIFMHQFLGGYKTSGLGWYGRGSGTHISASRMTEVRFGTVENALSEEEAAAQAGTVGIQEELKLHQYARRYGVTAIVTAHDHQFAHVIKDSVNYISAPPPWGWFYFSAALDGYGERKLFGSDKAGEGMQHSNALGGYLLFEVTADTCTMTMRYVVEGCAHAAYAGQNAPGFYGKFLSDPLDTIESGAKVTLPGDDVPKNVFAVCEEDDGDFVEHADPVINQVMQFAAANIAAFDKFTGYGADRWDEPWADHTVTLESSATGQVRADWVPRPIYQAGLDNPESQVANLKGRRKYVSEFQANETVQSKRDLYVLLVDDNDLQTPVSGLSPSVDIVKAGGSAFAPIAGSVDEVSDGNGSGVYRIRLAQADVDTEGTGMLKVAAAGAATQFVLIKIVRFLDEVHLVKATLANNLTHNELTGVDKAMDDDGETVLLTRTPVVDVELAGADWTDSTKRLTETGAFANYIHETGDKITLTAGTGVVTGEYTIADKIDDDTIELTADINAAAGDITDNSVTGLISNDRIMVTAS